MRVTVYLNHGEPEPGPYQIAAGVRSGRVPMTFISEPWQVLGSDGHTWYEVSQLPDGRWVCMQSGGSECRGFEYRGTCRHLDAVQSCRRGLPPPEGTVLRVPGIMPVS